MSTIYIPNTSSNAVTTQFLYSNFVPNGVFNAAINNTIPLTGTSNLTGSLVPANAYTYSLANSSKPFNGVATAMLVVKNIDGTQTNMTQGSGSPGVKYLTLPSSQGTSGQILSLTDNVDQQRG
jgi:hypothetical protein